MDLKNIINFFNFLMEPFSFFYFAFLVLALLLIAEYIIRIISFWRIFKKAGKKSWISLIPLYRKIILLEIVGKSKKLIFLFWIPYNIYLYVDVLKRLSVSFGKNKKFAIGLLFLPFVFFPILAFGKSKYTPIHSH